MKALFSIGGALALAAAVQLHAQDKSSTHPVTISGCLQRADKAHPTGTSGTVGTSATTDAFVLLSSVNVNEDARRGTKVAPGLWYTVVGNTSELRSRMNHRVEITGTLDTAGSVVGTSASATEGPSGTIHAQQIEVINASCNQ
jgi:hypothetical protein